jgi:DnaJ domain/AP2 domain
MIRVPIYPLSCGLFALIDDEDSELVLPFKWWRLVEDNGRVYARGRIPFGEYRVNVLMHRWLLQPKPGQRVDHRNHDGLDNQRANIRVCTASQNAANMRKKASYSQFKGVKRTRNGKRWSARVSCNYKQHYLGTYTDEMAAAAAYDIGARHFHGEFATSNLSVLILEKDASGAWVEFDPLGVGAHASREEIERAYRLLASEHHPDKGGDEQQMARINRARDALLEGS